MWCQFAFMSWVCLLKLYMICCGILNSSVKMWNIKWRQAYLAISVDHFIDHQSENFPSIIHGQKDDSYRHGLHFRYVSSTSLAFMRGIHWGPVNSPHKRLVTQKMCPLMTSSWVCLVCKTKIMVQQSNDTRGIWRMVGANNFQHQHLHKNQNAETPFLFPNPR